MAELIENYQPNIVINVYQPKLDTDGRVLKGDEIDTDIELMVADSIIISVDGGTENTTSNVNTKTISFDDGDFDLFDESWYEKELTITVNKTGYNTYTQTFTIFGQDLTINVVLLKESYDVTIDGETSPIEQVYSRVLAYRKPMTNYVYYYKTDSSNGDVVTIVNTIQYDNRYGMVYNNSEIIIYQSIDLNETTYSDNCTPVVTDIDSDTSNVIVLNEVDWSIPNSNIINSVACSNGEITNVVTINEVNHSVVELDFTNIATIEVGGNDTIPYSQVNVNQVLYNYKGVELNRKESTITFSGDNEPIYQDETLTSKIVTIDWVGWDVPTSGDYLIVIEIIIPDSKEDSGYKVKCIYPTQFVGNYGFTISSLEACKTVRLFNNTFNSIAFSVSKLQSDNSFLSVFSGTISRCSFSDLQILQDGIYKLTGETTNGTYNYIHIQYCEIEACYLEYLKKLICCNADTTVKLVDLYDNLNFKMQIHTLFAQLNSEYGFNYMYDTIDSSKLAELIEMNTLIQRIYTQYCPTCKTAVALSSIVQLSTINKCCS